MLGTKLLLSLGLLVLCSTVALGDLRRTLGSPAELQLHDKRSHTPKSKTNGGNSGNSNANGGTGDDPTSNTQGGPGLNCQSTGKALYGIDIQKPEKKCYLASETFELKWSIGASHIKKAKTVGTNVITFIVRNANNDTYPITAPFNDDHYVPVCATDGSAEMQIPGPGHLPSDIKPWFPDTKGAFRIQAQSWAPLSGNYFNLGESSIIFIAKTEEDCKKALKQLPGST